MVKRFSMAVALLVLLLSLPAGTALADNGPHGNYAATTDACAGCHRAHTANAPKLLADPVPDLCISCHGAVGTGADTNVEDGVYLERDSTAEAPQEGIANRGLKAGGFVHALMDTDWDNAAASAATTSNHLADGSTGMAWGNGAINSGPGATISLSCTSCHDPHGGAGSSGQPTYRLLRAVPLESGAASGVDVVDEADKIYTVTDTALKSGNKYFGEPYSNDLGQQLSEWCSQCHSRYLAGEGSGSDPSGDPIFSYRHMTSGFGCGCHYPMHGGFVGHPTRGEMWQHQRTTCVTCHVAHGSSASMVAYAGSVAWPDGATMPGGDARSALLRVDSRGTCQLCHGK